MIQKQIVRLVVVACATLVAACQDSRPPTDPSDDDLTARAGQQDPLPGWFARSSLEVLSLPGTVFADHDEANNRLLFGVENAAAISGVRTALTRLGIPSSAYAIEVTKPIVFAATLRDRFEPTQGGIQIHFGQFLCTLGFNVNHIETGGRSFITNSHCTNRQGGTEGTQYYQPTSTVDGTVIATEADDPQYFRGGACPRGRKCRYSDASRALYAGRASSQGVIARTTGANNGSLTVDETNGTFTVTAQDDDASKAPVGTVVNKVGRTTGWTRGNVTQTCVTTNVSGSNITQLCQTFVDASVAGGDSGSPVFVGEGDVTLVGILWGGSSDGSMYVFSPLNQIQQELGSLTATN
jgi:hypothetical protein